MALGKVPGTEEGESEGFFAEINITPLTDLFLVLLIIFMVTSSVIVSKATGRSSTSGMDTKLASDRASEKSSSTQKLVLTIMKTGNFLVDDVSLRWEDLLQHIKQKRIEQKELQIFIQADAEVPYGQVRSVVELLKQEGESQVFLVTGKK